MLKCFLNIKATGIPANWYLKPPGWWLVAAEAWLTSVPTSVPDVRPPNIINHKRNSNKLSMIPLKSNQFLAHSENILILQPTVYLTFKSDKSTL